MGRLAAARRVGTGQGTAAGQAAPEDRERRRDDARGPRAACLRALPLTTHLDPAGRATIVARMSAPHDLFAACQPGLEPLLVRELQALGAEPRTLPGGAAFRGDVRLAMQACLWLGTASHVL